MPLISILAGDAAVGGGGDGVFDAGGFAYKPAATVPLCRCCCCCEDGVMDSCDFCWILNAYEGGAGGEIHVCGLSDGGGGTTTTGVVVVDVVAVGTTVCGTVGAMAVCRTGFWTCVDLTLCIMMGGCVLVWRDPHALSGTGRGI